MSSSALSSEVVFQVHMACATFMGGLIWFVQIVHYPLFAKVSASSWLTYHRTHTTRTTFVVLPVMVMELATGLMLWWQQWPLPHGWLLGMLAVIWLSTLAIQVPIHNQLHHPLEDDAGAERFRHLLERLVLTNWIRTLLWSARAVVLLNHA